MVKAVSEIISEIEKEEVFADSKSEMEKFLRKIRDGNGKADRGDIYKFDALVVAAATIKNYFRITAVGGFGLTSAGEKFLAETKSQINHHK